MSRPSPYLPFDLPPRPSSSSSTRCSPIVSVSPIIASAKTIKMHSQTTLTTSSDMDTSYSSTPPPLPSRSIINPEQVTDADGSSALSKIQNIAREQRSKLVEINLAQRTSAMANVAKTKGFDFKDRAYEKGTEWTKFGRDALEKWKSRNSHEDLRGGVAGRRLSEGPIFGQPLEDAVERSKIDDNCPVPAVVIRCIEYLDCNGLNEVGLYRVPGSTSAVTRLKAIFDEGNDMDLLDSHEDPNAAATLLKMYLRELPDPIIPQDLLPEFSACLPKSAGLSPEQKLKLMENVPEKLALVAECLPEPNYYLLHWLMSHLARLDFYNAENKMTVSNLGLIFCPTLLISSVLFTAFVNHVGVVFPLPRKSSSRVSNAAPSSPVFVSRNPKRSSRQFPLNKPMDISSIWPPGTPSTQSQGNPESSKAFESDPRPLAPTGDLIDLSSANTTALDGVSSNSESISEDKAKDPAGHMNTTHTNDNKPATPSRTPSLGPNGKDDSGLISIDIDGNGLHMGVLNLNIRRSPAARGSHLPNMVSPIPNSKALNVTNSSENSSPQNPALPPRPARLTRKLTPRTTTKYVKDMLEFVDH